MSMKNHEYFSSVYSAGTAEEFIGELTKCLEKAKQLGWTKLYFSTEENGETLYGRPPASPEEEEKKRERRRKQYEKLKKEFEA